MPKVSVIIPVHNAGRHLRACLGSVLSQSLADVEVVCVENGSTDGSPELLSEFASADSRVRVVSMPGGRGAGAARNAGLSAASGKWVHFVDADDIVLDGAEETAFMFAEESGADAVVFGAEEYDDATGMVTPLPLDLSVAPGDDRFLRAYSTCPWNKLFLRSFIVGAGISFQEIPRTNDLAFTVEALCRAGKVAVLDRTLYRYRIHGGGSLQETKGETPDSWRDALAEARRRLEEAGVYGSRERAFAVLEADVRLANARSLPARLLASVRRRGIVSFAKHVVGYAWRRLVP